MDNPKKVSLVTGGAGFIGSELVLQLLDDDHKVIVYDNFSFGHRSNLPDQGDRLQIVEGDILDLDKLEKVFKDNEPNYVFHLAALHFIPYCISNPQETIRVNVEGTVNVLEAMKDNRPEAFVFASTAAIYPIKDTPNQEDDEPGSMEIYGASKLYGEDLVKLFYRETGVKCAVARLFNAFGPRETNPHVIPEIIIQLKERNRINLGNIEPKRDFIHTSDMCRAFRMLAESGAYEFDTFNLGQGEEVSIREVVSMMSEITGQPIKIVTDPTRVRKVERMHLVSDNTKIKETIGWEPLISLKQGFYKLLQFDGLVQE